MSPVFGDMFEIMLNSIGDAVLAVDRRGRAIYLNAVAEQLTGWSSSRAVGRSIQEVFHTVDSDTRRPRNGLSSRAIAEGRTVALELGGILIREDGSELAIEESAAPIRNTRGSIIGAVIVFHDARQSRVINDRISYLAYHDPLTGLPNRLLLLERLSQAVGMAERYHKQIALLFIDLDHFKAVNDAFGHTVGDDVLRAVSMELLCRLRTTDTLARIGGDEFVVLLTQIEHAADAGHVAANLVHACASQPTLCGRGLDITLSIGVSTYPEDGLDAGALMQCADEAMYRAKAGGRNGFEFGEAKASSLTARRTFT
jgi:diguanylate cyclase (GGDEF)-like protein/PAS domain S-box-containing protein